MDFLIEGSLIMLLSAVVSWYAVARRCATKDRCCAVGVWNTAQTLPGLVAVFLGQLSVPLPPQILQQRKRDRQFITPDGCPKNKTEIC